MALSRRLNEVCYLEAILLWRPLSHSYSCFFDHWDSICRPAAYTCKLLKPSLGNCYSYRSYSQDLYNKLYLRRIPYLGDMSTGWHLSQQPYFRTALVSFQYFIFLHLSLDLETLCRTSTTNVSSDFHNAFKIRKSSSGTRYITFLTFIQTILENVQHNCNLFKFRFFAVYWRSGMHLPWAVAVLLYRL